MVTSLEKFKAVGEGLFSNKFRGYGLIPTPLNCLYQLGLLLNSLFLCLSVG